MKKFKKVMLFVLPLLLMFSFVACKSSSNSIVGKWKPEGQDKLTESLGSNKEALKMLGLEGEIVFDFTEDNKLDIKFGDKSFMETVKSMAALGGEQAKQEAEKFEFTYKVEGDTLILKMMGKEEKSTFSIKDDKLTIKTPAGESVLTRVK